MGGLMKSRPLMHCPNAARAPPKFFAGETLYESLRLPLTNVRNR